MLKFNKIFVISLLLIAVLSLTAVSASEDVDANLTSVDGEAVGEVVAVDDSADEVQSVEGENVLEDGAGEVLSENSFNDIQTFIENAKSGDVININGEYEGLNSIHITKSITLDGGINRATLNNKNSKNSIIIMENHDITFKNLNFISISSTACYGYDVGNVTFINCNFINCHDSLSDDDAYYGGAIEIRGLGKINILSSNFINCSCKNGGAIGIISGDLSVDNSNFINCTAISGGAISCEKGIFKNSNFTNNSAFMNGGALAVHMPPTTIINCSFVNNFAKGFGGAVYVYGYQETISSSADLYLYNSTFNNNYQDYNSKILREHYLDINLGILIEMNKPPIVESNVVMGIIKTLPKHCFSNDSDDENDELDSRYYESFWDDIAFSSIMFLKNLTNKELDDNVAIMLFYDDEDPSIYQGNFIILLNDSVYFNQSCQEYINGVELVNGIPHSLYYSDLNEKLSSGVYNVKIKFITDEGIEYSVHESVLNVNLTEKQASNIVNNVSKTNSENAVKKVTKITLTLKKVTVKKSAKKLVLTATLKINGKVAKNKKLTFKFNKKTLKAKTNKKGIAKVTVKKSVLKKLKLGKKVKYQVSYGKKTISKTVKVKK